ncbi:hypothetical protein HMPREF1326_01262 [Akkermansia sp. KLE1605]|nr:hypothetical protein HMPREF1326_01262 [Akkermansia sp. KLE1605]
MNSGPRGLFVRIIENENIRDDNITEELLIRHVLFSFLFSCLRPVRKSCQVDSISRKVGRIKTEVHTVLQGGMGCFSWNRE